MIKPASGLILFYMNLCGFDGWTSLWNTIYLKPEYITNEGLIRHEQAHLAQMQRDGKLVYMIKYLWWNVTKGYLNNPYEIEARNAHQ